MSKLIQITPQNFNLKKERKKKREEKRNGTRWIIEGGTVTGDGGASRCSVGILALQVFDESTPSVILEKKKRKEDIWLRKELNLLMLFLFYRYRRGNYGRFKLALVTVMQAFFVELSFFDFFFFFRRILGSV